MTPHDHFENPPLLLRCGQGLHVRTGQTPIPTHFHLDCDAPPNADYPPIVEAACVFGPLDVHLASFFFALIRDDHFDVHGLDVDDVNLCLSQILYWT